MCTEVFLFFRREEICQVVNVVCISLHVCERKLKVKWLFYFYDLEHDFFPFFFLVYIELYVVKWLKPFYNSAHVQTNKQKQK